MQGTLASRHRKQVSSSPIKEPILLGCWFNYCTTSTKRLTSICVYYSEADAIDADLFLESLDATLFPGISPSVRAHSGFANEQAK